MFHLEMTGSERCSWRTMGWPPPPPKNATLKRSAAAIFVQLQQDKCILVVVTPGLFCQKAGWPVNEDKIRKAFFCWYAGLPDWKSIVLMTWQPAEVPSFFTSCCRNPLTLNPQKLLNITCQFTRCLWQTDKSVRLCEHYTWWLKAKRQQII